MAVVRAAERYAGASTREEATTETDDLIRVEGFDVEEVEDGEGAGGVRLLRRKVSGSTRLERIEPTVVACVQHCEDFVVQVSPPRPRLGRMPVGRMPVGMMPVGMMPVGIMPVGRMPIGMI